MSRIQLGAVLALLLTSQVVHAAPWPAREMFKQACLTSARDALDAKVAEAYCECTVASIAERFTPAQLAALDQPQLPADVQNGLREVSGVCMKKLHL